MSRAHHLAYTHAVSTRTISRRQLLQALGVGGASLLPFVPVLEAQASPPPKRIVFFFTTNGTIQDAWTPKMVSGQLELSPILSPLERFKSKLLVVEGLSQQVILDKGERIGHFAGMSTTLTGRSNKSVDKSNPSLSLATGVSLDQHLADQLGAATKLRSIECGVQVPYVFATLSYRGPLQTVRPENSPYRVFDRLFREVPDPAAPDGAAARERLSDRKRVLDAASKDLDALRGRLAVSDRVKMEAHIEAIRTIEHSLTTGAGDASGRACRRPEMGAPLDIWANDNIPALAKLHIDLIALAFACDLTRVATVQFGSAGAGHRFTWLGPEFATDPPDSVRGFHALAHRETEPASKAKLIRIHRWYAQQFAYLLERLDAIPEAGGSVLDHTAVVWCNELGTGSSHWHYNTPWVIAGSAGGSLQTGQLLSFPKEPHNRLLLTLCRAMGVPADTFGDPAYCKAGVLSGALR